MANFIITLLFGWTGIQRFMKKQTKMGLLYLFTGGLFGIGWIIDIFIALGEMKDSSKQPELTTNTSSFLLPTSFQLTGIHYESRKDPSQTRQEILKTISSDFNIHLEQYSYEGRPAYMVVVDCSGLDIGVVPENLASHIAEIGCENIKSKLARVYTFRDGSENKGAEIEIDRA